METDVIIIGAGGGGYPGAFRLTKNGYRATMIDQKGELGGNCLYSGCIPSKTIRELAQIIYRNKKLFNKDLNIDFSFIQDHKDRVQEIRYKQHREELKEYEENLELIKGKAKLLDNKTVEVYTEDKKVEIKGKYIIIATGSEPVKIDFPGSEYTITSDDLYGYKTKLRKLPNDITIIGGGYIAIETANILKNLGYNVRILVRGNRVLKNFEDEIVNTLLPIINLNIIYNAQVLRINKKGEDEYEVIYSKNGEIKSFTTGLVMLAIGRKPVLPIGAKKILNIDKNGYIIVDNHMRTNINNIFATGDVNGKAPYFHTAVRMSIAAANNIMKKNDYIEYKNIPVTLFTTPPASYVGILPSEAKKNNIEYIEASYDMEKDAMGQMYDETNGKLKLYFEKNTLRLIGAWMVGINAEFLINELGQAVANNLTAKDLANFAEEHPTTSELISYTARKVI
ncbi:dihydrolipoyl dehydrogenase [Nanoarchaeota archaeon]